MKLEIHKPALIDFKSIRQPGDSANGSIEFTSLDPCD